MRRIHLAVGLFGAGLPRERRRVHALDMEHVDTRTRFLLRSRHIYILFGSLVNLALAAYIGRCQATWRRRLQTVGSLLVIAALVSLAVAFPLEAVAGKLSEDWARLGVFATAAGTICHVVARLRSMDA